MKFYKFKFKGKIYTYFQRSAVYSNIVWLYCQITTGQILGRYWMYAFRLNQFIYYRKIINMNLIIRCVHLVPQKTDRDSYSEIICNGYKNSIYIHMMNNSQHSTVLFILNACHHVCKAIFVFIVYLFTEVLCFKILWRLPEESSSCSF